MRAQRRSRVVGGRRDVVVKLRVTESEKELLAAAAERAGLALGAYIAEAAVENANGKSMAVSEARREAIIELNRAWTTLAKVGVNLNQAVKALHSGHRDERLAATAEFCHRLMRRIADAVEQIAGDPR